MDLGCQPTSRSKGSGARHSPLAEHGGGGGVSRLGGGEGRAAAALTVGGGRRREPGALVPGGASTRRGATGERASSAGSVSSEPLAAAAWAETAADGGSWLASCRLGHRRPRPPPSPDDRARARPGLAFLRPSCRRAASCRLDPSTRGAGARRGHVSAVHRQRKSKHRARQTNGRANQTNAQQTQPKTRGGRRGRRTREAGQGGGPGRAEEDACGAAITSLCGHRRVRTVPAARKPCPQVQRSSGS